VSRDEYFFEGLKNQIRVLSVYAPTIFLFFCILVFKKNTFFKFVLASMKTLTNSGDFKGSRIRISNSGGTSKKIGNLNSADSQSSACDFEK
jgi:hypothetical protein